MILDSVRTWKRENSAAWGVVVAVLVGLMLAACISVQTDQTRVATLPESSTPAVAIVSSLAVRPGNAKAITSSVPTPPAQWAFLHDHALYIHHNGQEIPIESCLDKGCQIYYMRWSPQGSYLFYYVGPAELSIDRVKTGDEPPHIVLRVADLHGQVRTLTDKATVWPPPPWSSYLETVIHFEPDGLYGEFEWPTCHGQYYKDEPLFEEVAYEDLIKWPTCHGKYIEWPTCHGQDQAWQDWEPEIVDTDQFQYAPPPLELLDDFGPGAECGVHRHPHAANGEIED